MNHNNNTFDFEANAPMTPLTPAQRYFTKFLQNQSSGGIVLLICTVVALLFANIPALSGACAVWQTEMGIHLGSFELKMSLLQWVNDGLMVIFFFSVGMEIKRELVVGQLSSRKKASLPVLAAVGGMLFPALIFTFFNYGNPHTDSGWGVPMATDIAFAIGIISLLGNRVPIGVKVLLTALAIADDLGSIVVLALFYPTHAISFPALGIALAIFAVLLICNKAGVYSTTVYIIGGIIMWFFVLSSGIHATIAGVLLAITIPMKGKVTQPHAIAVISHFLGKFKDKSTETHDLSFNADQQHIVHALSEHLDSMEPMLHKFETKIQSIVNFFIMPLFALANAAVVLHFDGMGAEGLSPVVHGIFFGLLLGKPLGITLFSLLAVKLKISDLPEGTSWRQIFAMGILGGIGFTMSIFIDNLAFADQTVVNVGKVAILVTSATAALLGLLMMHLVSEKQPKKSIIK